MHTRAYTYIHICVHMLTHAGSYSKRASKHRHTLVHAHTFTIVNTRITTYTRMHIPTYTYIHTCVHTLTHAGSYTNEHPTHTNIPTYAHAHAPKRTTHGGFVGKMRGGEMLALGGLLSRAPRPTAGDSQQSPARACGP
jgi:hypothetical protein